MLKKILLGHRTPAWIAYLPRTLWGLAFALRNRRLLYFTTVNHLPGGEPCLGLPKSEALSAVPMEFRPKTLRVPAGAHPWQVRAALHKEGMAWPLVVKPDQGRRGEGVAKVRDLRELTSHLNRVPVDLVVQELLTEPFELGILYYRLPGCARGSISSIGIKQLLAVTGDGTSTIARLIDQERDRRRRYFLRRVSSELPPEVLAEVPAQGEICTLELIGQPGRGATMRDGNHLRTDALEHALDRICGSIPGFHYGRLDIKVASLEALRRGEMVRVMEINGVGSVPLDALDPDCSLLGFYRILFRHSTIVSRIAHANIRRGVRCMSLPEAIRSVRAAGPPAASCAKRGGNAHQNT